MQEVQAARSEIAAARNMAKAQAAAAKPAPKAALLARQEAEKGTYGGPQQPHPHGPAPDQHWTGAPGHGPADHRRSASPVPPGAVDPSRFPHVPGAQGHWQQGQPPPQHWGHHQPPHGAWAQHGHPQQGHWGARPLELPDKVPWPPQATEPGLHTQAPAGASPSASSASKPAAPPHKAEEEEEWPLAKLGKKAWEPGQRFPARVISSSEESSGDSGDDEDWAPMSAAPEKPLAKRSGGKKAATPRKCAPSPRPAFALLFLPS